MKLPLLLLSAVGLILTLIHRAESLQCHACANEECSNTTLVTCPILSTVCITVTAVALSDSAPTVSVNKNCSSLLTCITPLNTPTQWSVNRGFAKTAFHQLCCMSDSCNLPTLAAPNLLPNGKQCLSCASEADSQAGTCNATLSCAGVEDACFQGNAMVNSTEVRRLGCITRNFCSLQLALEILLGPQAQIVCGAPWTARISGALLLLALAVQRFLV